MSVREADESVTGSVNYLMTVRVRDGRGPLAAVDSQPMHLRAPSFSRGFTSFLWGLGLGLYVWVGLLAVGVDGADAFLFGLLAGFGIFFFVLRFGGARYKRAR